MGAGLVGGGGEIAVERVVALVAAVVIGVGPRGAEECAVVRGRRCGVRGGRGDVGEERSDGGGVDGVAVDEAGVLQLRGDGGGGGEGEAAGGGVPGARRMPATSATARRRRRGRSRGCGGGSRVCSCAFRGGPRGDVAPLGALDREWMSELCTAAARSAVS